MSGGQIKKRLKVVFGLYEKDLSHMSSLDMWIYSYRNEKLNGRPPKILFTGFDKYELKDLELKAIGMGFQIMEEFHRNLYCLVVGSAPNEYLIKQSQKKHVPTLEKDVFIKLGDDLTRNRLP